MNGTEDGFAVSRVAVERCVDDDGEVLYGMVFEHAAKVVEGEQLT